MNNITMHPLVVCLKVQEYLRDKYNIDFATSGTKIFSLAPKLKGKYSNPDLVSCEEYAEDLYKLYIIKEDF